MNKKLLAVAVAGALAAPAAAFAQSAVTISGYIKLGVDALSVSSVPNLASGQSSRLNNSQIRMSDGSSQIIFGMREDLGNGLAAVGQADGRFDPSTGSAFNISGNSFVGLDSTQWGRFTYGRFDLHYGKAPAQVTNKAGALQGAATSLFDYIGLMPIANATRTPSVMRYDMPNFSGFTGIIAYSVAPVSNASFLAANAANATTSANEQDMLIVAAAPSSNRKGGGWNINPKYSNGPFNIEYSYWAAKADAPITAAGATAALQATSSSLDQRADVLAGSWQFGGLNVGLGYNRSQLNIAANTVLLGQGTKFLQRTAWSIPVTYAWGPHTLAGHYTKAQSANTAVSGVGTTDTGARMLALAYVYDLSKRTSVAVTYANIKNDTNANYNFFTGGALGSADSLSQAGENPKLLSFGVKHAF